MDKTPGNITIEINSPGGSVSDGMAIVDCINKAKKIESKLPNHKIDSIFIAFIKLLYKWNKSCLTIESIIIIYLDTYFF